MSRPIYLGVNVDHVATLREARGTRYPDPVHAALLAEQSGADSITMHLREDRRHVQDRDIYRMAEMGMTKLNFEMAATDEMCRIALEVKPADVCLVPEKREELTTEGGLNVLGMEADLKERCAAFAEAGVRVSLFIDPDNAQLDAAVRVGAPVVELHTGAYADAETPEAQQAELEAIITAAHYADSIGLVVNAGHGLTRFNVQPIAEIPVIHELNIGHALIADSVFMGLPDAVTEMKRLMSEARYR